VLPTLYASPMSGSVVPDRTLMQIEKPTPSSRKQPPPLSAKADDAGMSMAASVSAIAITPVRSRFFFITGTPFRLMDPDGLSYLSGRFTLNRLAVPGQELSPEK
jgi:hypothetical protein